MEGLIIPREFDFSEISKRHSEDLQKEYKRLGCLKLKTIIKYAAEVGHRTKTLLASLTGNNETRKRKRNAGDGSPRPERARANTGE